MKGMKFMRSIAGMPGVILLIIVLFAAFFCSGSGGKALAEESKGNAVSKIFADAAAVAKLMSCYYNMKTIEGACELYMMDNGEPKTQLTVAVLISEKCLKNEPKCPLDKTKTYTVDIKDGKTTIKCPVHGKTQAETDKIVEELKKAGKVSADGGIPDQNAQITYTPASIPVINDVKKSAALKTFMEVFTKCNHDASVTVQSTRYEFKPPSKVTQYNYFRDPANFRFDTRDSSRKVVIVVSTSGPSWMSENDGKPSKLPPQQVAEIIATLDLGSLVCNNIDAFDLIESKDKNNDILIYVINKKTGYMNTYVIDPKLKVFKRICAYPKKGVLAMDNIYGPFKFGKLDDKVFAPPAGTGTGAAK